jgi:Fe-S cluster assembly iron-binding protein IscA
MALDEPKENEKPVQVNGIDVLMEDFAQALMDSTIIDYVDEPSGRGFVVKGDGASAC